MKFNFLKSLAIIFIVGTSYFFTSCNNDALTEETPAQAREMTAKTSQKSSLLDELKQRKDQFVYFKNKLDGGADITQEFETFVKNETPPSFFNENAFRLVQKAVLSAIDPNTYVCGETPELDAYINASTANWAFIDVLYYYFLSYHPTYDAYLLADPSDRGVFGPNGEYTNELRRTFKNLQRFWDIDSSNIGMVPMTGRVYRDIDRLIIIESILYPSQTDEENRYYAEVTSEIFGQDQFWNHTHPLLSFNAFAVSYDGELAGYYVGDRIAMGDGIMMAYDAIGLGDAGPSAILAHEFGHHIQYDNNYFNDVPAADQPEETRRTELMADAFSAYYLTHKRGATMNWWRVNQFMDVFYNIGDCGFTSSGHHGTHAQRMAAGKWGYDVATGHQKKGQILGAHEFYLQFEAALNSIVNCADCL